MRGTGNGHEPAVLPQGQIGVGVGAAVRQQGSRKRKGAPTALPNSLTPQQPAESHPGPKVPSPIPSDPAHPEPSQGLPTPDPPGVSAAPPPPHQPGSSQGRTNKPRPRRSTQKRVSFAEQSTEASPSGCPGSRPPPVTPSDPPEAGARIKGKARAILADAGLAPEVSVHVPLIMIGDDDDVVELERDDEPVHSGGEPPPGSPQDLRQGGGGEVLDPAPARKPLLDRVHHQWTDTGLLLGGSLLAASPTPDPGGTVTIDNRKFLMLTEMARLYAQRNRKE